MTDVPHITDRRGQQKPEDPPPANTPANGDAGPPMHKVEVHLTRDFAKMAVDMGGLNHEQACMALRRALDHLEREMLVRDFVGRLQIQATAQMQGGMPPRHFGGPA